MQGVAARTGDGIPGAPAPNQTVCSDINDNNTTKGQQHISRSLCKRGMQVK